MTGQLWLAVAGLLGAALVAAWPSTTARARHRGVLRAAHLRRSRSSRHVLFRGRNDNVPGGVPLAVFAGAVAGAALAGPVAAVATGAYGGLGLWTLLRRRATRAAAQRRALSLDALCARAADLRAGLPVAPSPAGLIHAGRPDRLTRLTRAAATLAEQTGAPLADLLDRIEADARAMDRAVATAAAQAAGARATAWLLAALPVGGIALGYGIGADPLRVLLHTPVGAACAIGAIGLQLAGLAWANRLGRAPGTF
ncbi:tight adherence protein B [Micromonospora pattaloongensis]|uniref:Tight adherence protein B n=1 Tax=Micromonospora pattaloongensis TaxID=405436 RepID=A0A1H3SDJ6_9ACTN|nr:tight adherence protein B [Micromonospora pattaloongensis]